MNIQETIQQMLTQWDQYSQPDYFTLPGNEALMTYGTGYGGWAVQTTQKAAGAIAMLGAAKNDTALIQKALRLLRFNLESHISGSITCLDGRTWGHTWISVLGIERMMHGIDAIEPYMTVQDRALLKTVLISECDWICDCYDVKATPLNEDSYNRPESNAWNGAVLFRTAAMYPDIPRAKEYRERADAYFINAISLPTDLEHNSKCVGNNFFETYALNHHGYLNIGYMVITLSQIAMLHFFCKKHKVTPPESLCQHVSGLWQLVKTCTAPDGRLIRIGGDTRVRYCYCQDYAIPVWLFAKDYLGDHDCDQFLHGWVGQVQREMDHNGDGSFLSARCGNMRSYSPVYYTRLESDRAVALSMVLAWIPEPKTPSAIPTLTSWSDPYHGAVMVRDKGTLISWTWRGASGPLGLCLPETDSNLAQWDNNLAGEIKGLGLVHKYELLSHHEQMFDGGFLSMGTVDIVGQLFEAEQQEIDNIAREKIVFALLPDSQTAVVMQYAYTPANLRSYVSLVKGLKLNIPNDLFSKGSRHYFHKDGQTERESLCAESAISIGKWLNVDKKLGVYLGYGKENLTLYSPGTRQSRIERAPELYTGFDTGNLCSDEILTAFERGLQDIQGEQLLIDTGAVIMVNATPKETQTACNREQLVNVSASENSKIRYVEASAADGNIYGVLANFGDSPAQVQMHCNGNQLQPLDASWSPGQDLSAGTAVIFCVNPVKHK